MVLVVAGAVSVLDMCRWKELEWLLVANGTDGDNDEMDLERPTLLPAQNAELVRMLEAANVAAAARHARDAIFVLRILRRWYVDEVRGAMLEEDGRGPDLVVVVRWPASLSYDSMSKPSSASHSHLKRRGTVIEM